jgi:hypothetical protein
MNSLTSPLQAVGQATSLIVRSPHAQAEYEAVVPIIIMVDDLLLGLSGKWRLRHRLPARVNTSPRPPLLRPHQVCFFGAFLLMG